MKKGFTLVEMLIVVSLVAVLAVLVGASVVKIKKDATEKLYQNKVSYIESAAISWGEDNINLLSDACNNVLVRTLISKNYINGEDEEKTIITNPLNGNSMNDMQVCVKYEKVNEKYKITAEMVEE